MTEQVKEARMSAAVKLQRAFQRQQEKSEASRRRGEELLKKAKESQQQKMQQANEETVDQAADHKKQLKKFKDMVDKRQIDEVITKATPAGEVISDFIHSDNPKFAGKSKAKRKEMALAAYYAKQRNEEVDLEEGTIQPSGTDKVEVAGNEVPANTTKGKTVKQFKFFVTEEETQLNEYEISHDGKGNYRDDEGNEWSSSSKNAPRGRFARKHTITSNEPDHPHAVHINGKKWKTFGSHSHASNVAKKIKGATVHKEEFEESYDFDSAAMAKQELADVKNKKHRGRGKVANLLRKLGMKEEVAQIDELSRDTLLSYANKVSLDSQKHSKDPTKRSGEKASRSVTGYARAHDRLEKPVKEEVEQIDEVNHREYASAGKMHPTMANHMTAGQETDFYHSSTGDKLSGVVKHKSDKEVHIKAHKDGKMGAGEMHKFQISEELKGGQVNLDKNHNGKLDKQDFKLLRKKLKEGKAVNVDKVNTAGETPHEEKWEDAKKKEVKKESFTAEELLQALKEGLWPGTPEHTAKFGDKYKQSQGGGSGIKRGHRYGGSLQKDEPDHDEDDEPKKAGRKVGSKSGARSTGTSKLINKQ
jgi:hypothetical protein